MPIYYPFSHLLLHEVLFIRSNQSHSQGDSLLSERKKKDTNVLLRRFLMMLSEAFRKSTLSRFCLNQAVFFSQSAAFVFCSSHCLLKYRIEQRLLRMVHPAFSHEGGHFSRQTDSLPSPDRGHGPFEFLAAWKDQGLLSSDSHTRP
jgi:hypothetical protein